MFEGGVDYRRDTHLKVFAKDTNTGMYYQVQLLLPKWELDDVPSGGEFKLSLIHEIGTSIGLRKKRKFLGMSYSRVRVGF